MVAAWHRPDRFRRVVGFLSSFAQMPGGNPYPAALPAEPRKPDALRWLWRASPAGPAE